MRIAAIILLGLAIGVSLARPATAQVEQAVQQFDRATEAIESGRYADAVEQLVAVRATGFESPALHYNLGIAYYRLDRLGEAVRSFERARRLDPDDRRIVHNLMMARTRTVDQFSKLPTPIWTRVWQRAVTAFGSLGLFLFGFLGYVLAMGLLAYRIHFERRSAWLRRGIWAGTMVAVIGLSAGLLSSARPPYGTQAVVLSESVPLVEQAGDEAEAVLEVHEGLTVDVLSHEGTWTRVRLPNGTTGWIENSALGTI